MLLENSPYPQDDRVRREALALTAAGHRVSVIAPARKGQPRRERVDGVEVYRYPGPPGGGSFLGYLVEYAWSLTATAFLSIWALVRGGFDVVHAHNPPDLFVFLAAFYRLLGKRSVFDLHDLAPEMYFARFDGEGNAAVRRVLIWLEGLSCRVANRIIVPNESYRQMVRERHGQPDEKITTVRNGPDLERIYAVDPDPSVRNGASAVIGYVGVIGYQDGLGCLLRAMAALVYELGVQNVRCVILGTGDALAEMRELSTELGLDDVVTFTGWVSDDDLRRYMSTADICVVPDPSNPFTDRSTMTKLAEYMALGKPVVAFDLPEHRVTGGEAAVYATPNDERDFARALARLIDDPAAREQMGRYGIEQVAERLKWEHSIPSLLQAYESGT